MRTRLRPRQRGIIGAMAIIGALISVAGTPAAHAAEPAPCSATSPGGPLWITAGCVDPTYASPVIDSESDVDAPVPHHLVSGHFEGTGIQFTIYLHAERDKSAWEGRFFQYTYPTTFGAGQSTARADDRAIGFALSSGGYAVQAGNGSVSLGYRHTAAAAKFAESVAASYYGSERQISGYLYGPSGGSFQVVGAAENTDGVWEGFVPIVQAVPQPTSYNFQGRSAAELILGDKAELIHDALMPGGSGDPYDGLDGAEQAMLTELHALGVPWQSWEYVDYLLGRVPEYQGAGLDSDDPLRHDPTYVDDFWNAEGYLGVEESPLGDRVRAELVEMGDTPGHRWNIAKRFYYRYQTPPAEQGWIALDQFRNADGTPLHPQRPVADPGFHGAVSGNTAFDGSVNGKMIVVDNLYDTDALPWHADWYRQQVESSLGSAAADTYRLYFNDHADHQEAPVAGERAQHLVDWYGIVEQSLRDIARWAEDGVPAPQSTRYAIDEAQIIVADSASARRGLQPTVEIRTGAQDLITAEVGQTVKFVATAQTPGTGGKIVAAEWDFEGDGTYISGELRKPKTATSLKASHTFTRPGTYFVAVRVTAERDGAADAEYALLQNIDRVRVVVTE